MFVVFPKYYQFLTRVYDWCHPRAAEMTGSAPNRVFIPLYFGIRLDSTTARIRDLLYDSDVISFHIYANWFSPPSCG